MSFKLHAGGVSVKVGFTTMLVKKLDAKPSDILSEDEILAIVYALRDRKENVSGDYAFFLSLMISKFASLTDHDFTEED